MISHDPVSWLRPYEESSVPTAWAGSVNENYGGEEAAQPRLTPFSPIMVTAPPQAGTARVDKAQVAPVKLFWSQRKSSVVGFLLRSMSIY